MRMYDSIGEQKRGHTDDVVCDVLGGGALVVADDESPADCRCMWSDNLVATGGSIAWKRFGLVSLRVFLRILPIFLFLLPLLHLLLVARYRSWHYLHDDVGGWKNYVPVCSGGL